MPDKKVKRPTFQAPTPPKKVEETLENDTDEVVENNDKPSSPAKPVPPKTITKSGPDKESSFTVVTPTQDDSIAEEFVEVPYQDQDLTEEPVKESPIDKPNDQPSDTPDKPTPPPTPMPSKSKQKSNGPGILKIGLLLLLIIFAGTGWYLYLSTAKPELFSGLPGSSTSQPTPAVSPTPATPSATPTPVDKTAIKIQVLNGAGVAGAAGRTAETIEGFGYEVVDTGNADSSDYDTTEIYVATDVPQVLTDLLLQDLQKEFGSASVSGELETSTAGATVQIILGTDWIQ